ncbi:hypothetical protein LCGC14_1281050 [marine sediment metagenome]|uniref:Uncharacterized protein n=1 Tax=marine sediment metagenome TaxID=412755 RepID=A0A0F9KV56_9ZZZZ
MASLLVWLWDDESEEWIKSPAVISHKRIAVTGQVVTGHRHLHWISTNPSAGNSLFELTDNTSGLGDPIFDHFDTTRDSHVLNFNPPWHFGNGIYVKTLTNFTSLIFGYV